MTKRRCWNGCAAEPWREGNVFCKECYDRCIRTGSSRPTSARAVPKPRSWSFDDIKRAFEDADESHEPKRKPEHVQ